MMNTRNYLDDFTPAMKAKLDPNYRRNSPGNEFSPTYHSRREYFKNKSSLLPFTSVNKVNRVIDRIG